MKIYFDVSTLNPEKVTGVGVYMLQLFRHLRSSKDLQVAPTIKVSRLKNKSRVESILGSSCQIHFPWKIFSAPESLFFGPDFKLSTRGFLPQVVMIHDMVVFEEKYNLPDFYLKGIRDLTRVLNSSALAAVLVNSEFTRQQVVKFFPHLQGQVHVTYLGCNRTSAPLATKTLDLPERYILFLGTLEKRKNILSVIKAFEILKSQGASERLVLAGAWGFGAEEIQRVLESSPYKNEIVHLNYVSDEKVAELYQRAQVFFFPSWYEGFGIPTLEAMSLGCPVVTSRGGALQEVCGDAALFVDPGNPEEMAQALKRVLDDSGFRDALRLKGLARSQQFTWEKCAQQTLQVFKKILRKS